MDNVDDLLLLGLSHRTAPVAVRERYAISGGDLHSCLRELVGTPEVQEACVLSTCNRTEVLLLAHDGADCATSIRRRLFRNLSDEHLYVFRGVHAIIHLFRVASGIDSLVVGESEIQGQLRQSFEAAQACGAAGGVLRPLLTQALRVGKRVRTETELGQGTLSVARVGVDIAHQVFGSLERRRALMVGAGDTARLVARHLRSAGARDLTFVNRTFAHAQEAAAELDGGARPIEELRPALADADLVVACVDACAGLVPRDAFDEKVLRRRARPLLVLDLSVPRAVDRVAGELENVLVYDLDDMAPVVEENKKNRGEATARAAGILVAEVHKFLALRTFAAFSPAIGGLRERFDAVREGVLDECAAGSATPRELQIAHELVRRLLDAALSTMKEGARHARSEAALDREYQRFLDKLGDAP